MLKTTPSDEVSLLFVSLVYSVVVGLSTLELEYIIYHVMIVNIFLNIFFNLDFFA
jgi:hypothetical protein